MEEQEPGNMEGTLINHNSNNNSSHHRHHHNQEKGQEQGEQVDDNNNSNNRRIILRIRTSNRGLTRLKGGNSRLEEENMRRMNPASTRL